MNDLKKYEYYRTDLGVLYHGDCLEIMPQLESVDLVLTDPPYGIANIWKGGAGGASSWKIKATETHTWDTKIFKDIQSVIEQGGNAIIWGGIYYQLPVTRSWFVWDKLIPDTFTVGNCELAWTNLDIPTKCFRLAHVIGTAGKVHPTQKPTHLFMWCLKFKNGSVLDPFFGAGTTGVCCERLKRKWIGIEIEEKYCEIAKKRIELERKQRKLF